MKNYYKIESVEVDSDGITLYGIEYGTSFYIIIPKSVIRRLFVLLLQAMR